MSIDYRQGVSCPVCGGMLATEVNSNKLCTYHRMQWMKRNNKKPDRVFRTG